MNFLNVIVLVVVLAYACRPGSSEAAEQDTYSSNVVREGSSVIVVKWGKQPIVQQSMLNTSVSTLVSVNVLQQDYLHA